MNIKFKRIDQVFNLKINRRYSAMYACPLCGPTRKKKNEKTLRWYVSDKGGSGFCHHCREWCHEVIEAWRKEHFHKHETAFTHSPPQQPLQSQHQPPFQSPPPFESQPQQPTDQKAVLTAAECDRRIKSKYPPARRSLSQKATAWLQSRGISSEVATEMGVFSAIGKDNQEMIGFVYRLDGLEYNIKFRFLDKKGFYFALANTPKIAYNADVLSTEKSVIITEGEMDALAFRQVGANNAMSPPFGAAGDQEGWMQMHASKLAAIEHFFLAVDTDEAGDMLRQTLLDKWGYHRCSIITFDDQKDANDLLIAQGEEALIEAKIQHTTLIYNSPGSTDMRSKLEEFMEYFKNGGMKGEKLGFAPIDEIVSWRTGTLALICGIPSHGKSGFLDFLMMLLNLQLDWKAAIYSPENFPDVHHASKFVSMLTGKQFNEEHMSDDECRTAFFKVCDQFIFITPTLTKLSDILEAIALEVKHNGVKVAVIDPFNSIRIDRNSMGNETDMINVALDEIHRFARLHNILFFVVAHPRKMESLYADQQKGYTYRRGKYKSANQASELSPTGNNQHRMPVFRVPNLYDVMNSSNFYNHVDYGIIVYRDYSEQGGFGQKVNIIFEKLKWVEIGAPGACTLGFNITTNRYEDLSGDIDEPNASWL